MCFCRDNEDDLCLLEKKKRFRPLMTLKQRRRSLLSVSAPIQIPSRQTSVGSDGTQDSGISGSPMDRWKRAVRQVQTLSDPWAQFNIENLPTEKAKRYRYSALKKKWVTDDVYVKMETEVCRQVCSLHLSLFWNFVVKCYLLTVVKADVKNTTVDEVTWRNWNNLALLGACFCQCTFV